MAGAPAPLPAPAGGETERLAAAIRRAPSPIAGDPGGCPLHSLEPEQPGICARARERGWEAVVAFSRSIGSPPPADDPRLGWEPMRLGALVLGAAGARAARGSEAVALAGAVEAGARGWLEEHPCGRGAAWESPLEVALRAWNLWIAVSLLGPDRLSDRGAAAIGAALAAHGRDVVRRLEDSGLVVGSHLVGELVGLHACGAALAGAGEEPARWRRLARAGLEAEARRQILADGAGAEGSTGYARFVAELWLAAACAARAAGEPPLWRVEDAARASLRWLAATIAPDGRDLGIGDDDGSRVLPPGDRDPRQVAPLLPLAAALLGEASRPEGIGWSEEAAWLAGAAGRARFLAARPAPWPRAAGSAAFGLYVGRRGGRGGDLVSLRAGPHGQGGAGGHAHGDALAVTVWLDGEEVILDPGTGVYLGRPALRDRFRGAAAHASIVVDGMEPSPLPPTRPFALPDRARARRIGALDDGWTWAAIAKHRGYAARGIVVRREVRLDRRTRRVTIVDRIDGPAGAAPEVALTFPLGDRPAAVDGKRVRIGDADAPVAWLEIADRAPGRWRLDPAPWSPRYGEVADGLAARRVARARLPATWRTVIRAAGGEDR